MKQTLSHELLDADLGAPAEIERSLGELWWINQHLGGLSTWRSLLRAAFQGAPSPPSLLDVGAGSGQLASWLGTTLGAAFTVALDRQPTHLGSTGIRLAADALRLPFPDASFDLVTSNLFLHHFHGEAATALLGEMRRVARRAVLINDLERAWLPYLTISVLGSRFSRITRADGPASVRQAYTRGELQALAATALPGAEVLRLWPYRLGVIWRA